MLHLRDVYVLVFKAWMIFMCFDFFVAMHDPHNTGFQELISKSTTDLLREAPS